MKTLELNEEAQ